MAEYITTNIRNIALMGHGGEGKTTLTEAMLFAAGIIDRQGKVEDGTTVTDFEPEENKRKCSISAACAPIDWNDKMLNIIDVPGYFDFVGEMVGPLRVVETACIVVSGVTGISVGAEKAFTHAVKQGVGRMYVINQMDREHASFDKVIQQLRERHGSCVVPVLMPIGEGDSFRGVVNVLEKKAYEGAYKKSVEVPMPENMKDKVDRAFEYLAEQAAAADDDLMMKYLEEGELNYEEILLGFRKGMKDGSIVPVCACSALTGVGIARTMDLMAKYLPSPAHDGIEHVGFNPRNGESQVRVCKDEQPFSAFVYKTIADPFVGKLSLFRIFSGKLTSQTILYNVNKDKTEKTAGIYILRGKKQIAKQVLHAGDLGALSKLQYTATGDTLADYNNPIQYPGLAFQPPCISKAVYAAKQGEEDKVFSGLNRLMVEDPSITLEKNPDTFETLLSGQGEMHLDVIRNKLAAKFGANAVLQDPKIPYRETIRKSVKVQGRHKKQSGGHGQFGDVWIEFSPIVDSDEEFEFVDAVVGGVVPRNFIPSVEKGLRDNIKKGVLAGYPMVGLRAKLYDGSYHPVDSSEMAFKTAARIAYKKGCAEASPVLLEPIMHVDIIVPDEYMGDIMGDMNKRRGRIIGMNQTDGQQRVEAEAPMAEMFKYATDLRSMTQARGSFSMRFERYEEVPAVVAQKIIAAAVKDEDEDE
ncbi:MAG: elongation factor G [Eubacteriales bacterium]|nr:elongation factor G [Eubacteriales bacterium]